MLSNDPLICPLDVRRASQPIHGGITTEELRQATMSFDQWCLFTVTAQNTDCISNTTHVLFHNLSMSPSYPYPARYSSDYKRSPLTKDPSQFPRYKAIGSLAIDRYRERRLTKVRTNYNRHDQSMYFQGSSGYDDAFADAELISPTTLIMVEHDGRVILLETV